MAKFAFVAGVSPSLFGGLLAAGLVAVLGGNPVFTGTQWFMANLLGACIIYPFGLTISLRQFAKLKLERRFLEAFVLFAGLALTSVMAFRFGYPAMFLVLVISIATAARFRLLGAGAALLVVSTLAFSTVRIMPQAHTVAWVEVLQFYLATISAVTVRTAMLLNERDLHLARNWILILETMARRHDPLVIQRDAATNNASGNLNTNHSV